MSRNYADNLGGWNWPFPVSHRHGVRCGEMVFVGGQFDLDQRGRVRSSSDLLHQATSCMENLLRVLRSLSAEPSDLVKLAVFYVNNGGVEEDVLLQHLANFLVPGAGPV